MCQNTAARPAITFSTFTASSSLSVGSYVDGRPEVKPPSISSPFPINTSLDEQCVSDGEEAAGEEGTEVTQVVVMMMVVVVMMVVVHDTLIPPPPPPLPPPS
ncbi:hypothetical protein E2C01_089980 [Portunus trituberculatus]|uniref:Uncharacterized protein n=1 Tax=Portunus trituberculatus TaxID=210409 RepID=A0A5B7JR19_PORTR|nr:hypothetical protein [Portunus trituberculatus]